MKSEFRRLMEEDREGAKKLLIHLLKRKTTKQICVDIGVASTRALYLIKRDSGLLRQKFSPTQEELSTLTPRELAKAYSISLQRVYGYLREQREHARTEVGSGNEADVDTNNSSSANGPRKVSGEPPCGVPKS